MPSKDDLQFIMDRAREYIMNTSDRGAQQEMLARAYYLAVVALQTKKANEDKPEHNVLSKSSVNTR